MIPQAPRAGCQGGHKVHLLMAFTLLSQTFAAGSTVPQSMIALPCGGKNVSPQLHWTDAPRGTRSFALIVHDPDAPHAGGFYHWVIYNIASGVHALDTGSQRPAPEAGVNDTGSRGYFGPCPPPGKLHHYSFTLYALDLPRVESPTPLSAPQLLERMRGHVLGTASIGATLEL